MSPFLLRRYRADRLLREEFEALRERVIGAVDRRLRGAGAALDRSDLEAAYAEAWQGLHAAVLDGQQIVNPAGWLAVVTHRRAVDEHRARRRIEPVAGAGDSAGDDRDLAAELDDRAKLRSLLEALRTRLNERERKAAALCYLQGLSRAEAAARLGLSESRMRKLMEGAGAGLRGVAGKVGALVQAIAGGEWCEEQGSLMRGLAFGILDPQGDRYRLALSHSDACPACRAYVLSLRGLAVALPPVPGLLYPLLAAGVAGAGGGASAGALAGSGSAGAGAGGAGAGAGAGAGGSASATSASLGAGAGALSASGAGAAGGGWWLAGGVGAKLAAGCLLALGVGAGCVALEGHGRGATKATHGHVRGARVSASGRAAGNAGPVRLTASGAAAGTHVDGAGAAALAGRSRAVTAAARASREFGLERPSSSSSSASSQRARQVSGGAVASTASAHSSLGAPVPAPSGEAGTAPAGSSSPSPSAAAREFAPG
ncbi:MAG: sigma-70 family RNA polymerase sigma factor [Solirubrobacterales bacterium]